MSYHSVWFGTLRWKESSSRWKILHAYIRMLGAQIGKVPVSVGNGSDRIETSTIFSEHCQDFVCFQIKDSSWHDVDQPLTSSLLFCFATQYLTSDCMSTITMKCCGLHACSTSLVLSFSTSTEVTFTFPFLDGPTCLVWDWPLTSLPPLSLSMD